MSGRGGLMQIANVAIPVIAIIVVPVTRFSFSNIVRLHYCVFKPFTVSAILYRIWFLTIVKALSNLSVQYTWIVDKTCYFSYAHTNLLKSIT